VITPDDSAVIDDRDDEHTVVHERLGELRVGEVAADIHMGRHDADQASRLTCDQGTGGEATAAPRGVISADVRG
jgi:hypothetical protein